jgi:hypothetical protein
MAIDVLTTILICCPKTDVASYASDPRNAPQWYARIASAVVETPLPIRVGSRFRFEARFLGRTLVYTYEVIAFEPTEFLTMRATDMRGGMETSYSWIAEGPSSTRMVLRNRGAAKPIPFIPDVLLAAAIRRANRGDLARLRQILERR